MDMAPNQKQKTPVTKSVSFAPSTSDPRFSKLTADPRYRLPSKKRTHVKLDKRLGSILKDDAFSSSANVDRYGRKIPKGQRRKDLERLYRLASDDEAEESGEEDAVVENELTRIEKSYDPARDGGFSTSESESEDEVDVSDDEEEEVDAALPEMEEQVPMGEVSSRLAVVNLDWDNIRAEDIMSVASSFAPPEGRIVSVAVYPSEFGRERMEREEVEGPPKEIFQSLAKEKAQKVAQLVENDSSDSDDNGHSSEDENIRKDLLKEDSGAEFDSVALRKYQLDRLRYYYAVITCSSKDVAQALYNNMDGQEYLYSANFFDVRFIPDEVDFESDKPRESCKKVSDGYKPTEFTTDALMHSNVKLTWDADDTKRKEVQKRAFSRNEIDENDLLAYIGSASSSEDDAEDEEIEDADSVNGDVKSTTSRATTRQARREALRAALGFDLEPSHSKKSKKEGRHVGDMQITFTSALSSAKKGESVFENEPMTREETTAERYVRKERERKAKRKERAKARRVGQDPDALPISKDQAKIGDDLGADSAEEGAELAEGGFDDPFFDNPDAVIEESRKARRAEKARKKESLAEDNKSNSKDRAELELIMMDDKDQRKGPRHFDMKAVEKEEKAARKAAKSKKSKKKKAKEEGSGTALDAFEINVQDSRFSKLFNDPAFAIDPTDPKFRDTKGMRAILGEKRKRGEQKIEHQAKKVKSSNGTAENVKQTIERIGKRIKK